MSLSSALANKLANEFLLFRLVAWYLPKKHGSRHNQIAA